MGTYGLARYRSEGVLMSAREHYVAYAAVGPHEDARRWYHLGAFATEAEAMHEARNAARVYYVPVVRKVEL